MSDDDEGVSLPAAIIPDLQAAIDWYRENGARVLQALGQDKTRNPIRHKFSVRAVLLQDLYGGGYALAGRLKKVELQRTFVVAILGQNYVPNSKFKLKFSIQGEPDADGHPQIAVLGQTAPIDVWATADDLKAAIAGTLGSFFDMALVTVSLGNPYRSEDLILTPEVGYQSGLMDSEGKPITPPPDPTPPLQSFVGCWHIEFSDDIIMPAQFANIAGNAFPQFLLEVVQDDSAKMKGLSAVTVRATSDIITDTLTVWDCIGVAKPTPLKAGTPVACLDFVDGGYGVVAAGYADLNVDLTSAGDFLEGDSGGGP